MHAHYYHMYNMLHRVDSEGFSHHFPYDIIKHPFQPIEGAHPPNSLTSQLPPLTFEISQIRIHDVIFGLQHLLQALLCYIAFGLQAKNETNVWGKGLERGGSSYSTTPNSKNKCTIF